MNNLNKFAFNPVNLDMTRSKFPQPYDHKTTLQSGDLVPFYVNEVIAGDTFSMDFKSLTRMLTPVVPTMDNLFQDVWFFFVPYRLATTHVNDWQKITGENFGGYWSPQSESTLYNTGNSFKFFDLFVNNDDNQGFFNIEPQSLASYLGLPIGRYHNYTGGTGPDNTTCISKMPFVAYWKIWNEYFRDENTQAPIENWQAYLEQSNLANTSSNRSTYSYIGIQRVNKIHDLFTDVLPAPQKGPDVGVVLGGLVPVITGNSHLAVGTDVDFPAMSFKNIKSSTGKISTLGAGRYLSVTGDSLGTNTLHATASTPAGYESDSEGLVPDNLYVNIDTTVANVNGMRIAFAYQRFLEKNARGGTRFREYLKAHFGVSVKEGFVQVPEYLGGHRFPLMISQVLQTFEVGESGPLGTTGAWSNTYNEFKAFTKSFTEPGFIIGLTAIRPMLSYSQMVPRMFSRNRIIDWYHPEFANIGEQAVLNKEIFLASPNSATGVTDAVNFGVFGYQEAWYAERYKPNYVSGYLAPQANSNTFRPWTYCQYFTSTPVLNSEFKVQSDVEVANSLYDSTEPAQFILEAFCDVVATRPMPLFSIPGLIDHH